MRRAIWAVWFLVASLPTVAQDQIYKCIDGADHVTYQSLPCPLGSVHVPMGSAAVSDMDSTAVQQAGRVARIQELQRQQTALERQLEQSRQRLQSANSSTSSYQERLDARNADVRARASGVVPTGSTVTQAINMMGGQIIAAPTLLVGRIARS